MQRDVLNEAVAPPVKLLAHEAEVVRLDGVTDRFGHEAHADAGLVKAPGQIHVLGQRPARPSAVSAHQLGPIRGKTARRDHRPVVVVLHLLVEGECKQVFDEASPFPQGFDPARQDKAAGRADTRLNEGLHQPFDGGRLQRGIGIDRHHELGSHPRQGEGLRARLGARVVRGPNHGDAGATPHIAGAVGRTVVDQNDLVGRHRLREQTLDRVADKLGLVVGGDDHGQSHERAENSVGKRRGHCTLSPASDTSSTM